MKHNVLNFIKIGGLGVVAASLALGTLPAASSSAAAKAKVKTTTLHIGLVPGLGEGLLNIAKAEGYFAKYHLAVTTTPLDSGSAVVTGVVAGTYDLGYTAATPPLMALANGANLHFVVGQDTVGVAGTNSAVYVPASSKITSYAQLAGKTIASNAPYSFLSLAIEAAITKSAAANGTTLTTPVATIAPTDFSLIGQETITGQVAAGLTIAPYTAEVAAALPGLTNLGDPVAYAVPKGSPYGLYFTSGTSWTGARAKAIKNFALAMKLAIAYGNKHLALVNKYGGKDTGESATLAAQSPRVPFNAGDWSTASLAPILNLMVQQKWITTVPNVSGFFK
jgi:NitT/TauT family transport system substrate-binding protein